MVLHIIFTFLEGSFMDDDILIDLVKGVSAAEENENGPPEKTGKVFLLWFFHTHKKNPIMSQVENYQPISQKWTFVQAHMFVEVG